MKRLWLPDEWGGRAIVIANVERIDDWFADDELREAETFHLPKRREEWKLSRIAAKQLAIERGLAAHPRVCRIENRRIATSFLSLSHSRGYAAAAIDRHPIGVDIEAIRPISEAAAHLFLTDEEADVMRRTRIGERLLHFWAAKEAEWKRNEGAIETLKRVPIRLERENGDGLLFDRVETRTVGGLIVALTRPV
jgi:phosphopantetheinyl transferase